MEAGGGGGELYAVTLPLKRSVVVQYIGGSFLGFDVPSVIVSEWEKYINSKFIGGRTIPWDSPTI